MMVTNYQVLAELEERIEKLNPAEKLYLIARIADRLNHTLHSDPAADAADLDAMLADPGFQKVLRNEDLVTADASR